MITPTTRAALLIFLFSLFVYIIPVGYDLVHKPFFAWIPGIDLVSTSILPIEILERGDFYLDAYKDYFAREFIEPGFIRVVNGRAVSASPVTAAILALPFYGLPLGTGWLFNPGYAWLTFPQSAFFPAKFAAAFMTALTVLMFFFCARKLSDLRTSIALTIVFALGTSVWSVASQGLWKHTPGILLQMIGVWFILRGGRGGANAVAPGAFFFSAAAAARASEGLGALFFTLYVLLRYRSALLRWALWAVAPVILYFAYDAMYGGLFSPANYLAALSNTTSAAQQNGLVGLLISPSRGLFIYSPFFIFAPLGMWLGLRQKEREFYIFLTLICVSSLFVVSRWPFWDGGWGYGTRMLTDYVPFMMLTLTPVLKRASGRFYIVFAAMAVYALIVHSFALWDNGTRWHWHWENYQYDVWDWGESEPLFYLKQYIEMAGHYLRR